VLRVGDLIRNHGVHLPSEDLLECLFYDPEELRAYLKEKLITPSELELFQAITRTTSEVACRAAPIVMAHSAAIFAEQRIKTGMDPIWILLIQQRYFQVATEVMRIMRSAELTSPDKTYNWTALHWLMKAMHDITATIKHKDTLPEGLVGAFLTCYQQLAANYNNNSLASDPSVLLDGIFDVIPPDRSHDIGFVRCLCIFKVTIELDKRFFVRALFKGIERNSKYLVESILSGALSDSPTAKKSLERTALGRIWSGPSDYVS
jgi:hypothetical protein